MSAAAQAAHGSLIVTGDFGAGTPVESVEPVHAPLAPAALLIFLAGCPVAAGLPGTRTDVAPVTTISSASPGGVETGLQVAAGAHWASIADDPGSAYDFGAGYMMQRFAAPDLGSAGDLEPAAMRSGEARVFHAGYLSFDQRIAGAPHWRAWAGARGEMWFASAGRGVDLGAGAVARFGVELFATGSSSGPVEDRCFVGTGYSHGATAIGAFVDGGVRRLPGSNELAAVAAAGLSVRLPSLFVVGLAIPGCH